MLLLKEKQTQVIPEKTIAEKSKTKNYCRLGIFNNIIPFFNTTLKKFNIIMTQDTIFESYA
jgi:hypothetical protein